MTYRKIGLCCHLVSLRLSVTFVFCIQKAADIAKLLSGPSLHCSGENLRFLTEIAVYLSEMVRDRCIVATERSDDPE